jgi:hypothetical protein
LLHRAADILPIHVDAVRAGAVERGADIRGAVVDAAGETEFRLDIAAFVRSAGDTDDAGVGTSGELPGDRSYSA